MKPLQRAKVIKPPWTKYYADFRHLAPMEVLRQHWEQEETCWRNDLYVVMVEEHCADNAELIPEGWTWLSIRRDDRKPCRDWRHFQAIKNQLCGPEREAIELYPAEERVVDTANQFHLWVLPPGITAGVGFPTGRREFTTSGQTNFKQRAEEDT